MPAAPSRDRTEYAERGSDPRIALLVTAAAITLSALIVIVGASPRVAGVAEAEIPAPVRILDAPAATNCDQQTWPYIEPRCRKPADPLRPQPSSAPSGQSASGQAGGADAAAPVTPLSTSIMVPERQQPLASPTAGSALDASRPAEPDAISSVAPAPLRLMRDEASQADMSTDRYGSGRKLDYRHHRRHMARRFRHLFGFDH